MRVVLCAGEASGDWLAAGLMQALRERVPDVRFEGIAGPRMQALGCRSLYPMERLSVMGLVEVAGRYLEIWLKRRELGRQFIDDPPDVFVGVDAPDFNLALERRLRDAGIPTVHYVSPSVWAWREYRVKKIRRAVDRLLVVFPFEKAFYARHGMDTVFVGHHLADEIDPSADASAARSTLGLPQRGEIVALLPGSRMSEASRLSELLVATTRWLLARRPSLRFVVPTASDEIRECFAAAMARQGGELPVSLVNGHSHEAMAASNLVVLASGTASLEALLLKRPMVITYKTHPLTWAIGRRLLNVAHVGLPNLLAGESLVPELLQQHATPSMVGASALAMLDSPALLGRLRERFAGIHASLACDASRRAAEAVLAVAGRATHE